MEKEQYTKRTLRCYKLSRAKYFDFTVSMLEFMNKYRDNITIEYDKANKRYAIKLSGSDFLFFENGEEYNKTKKTNPLFAVLWAFSNLDYSFLKKAYEEDKPIKIQLSNKYLINRFINENQPQKFEEVKF